MRHDRPPVQHAQTEATSLDVRATEHLRYIREMMSRSGSFTAVPGWGSLIMGVAAIAAAVAAAMQPSPAGWLFVWLLAGAVAVVVGVATLILKARKGSVPLSSGIGRRYVLSLLPPLVAGALLTAAIWRHGDIDLLPALWLLLYGAGTITGGVFSVKLLPLMGVCFMTLGTAAIFLPLHWGNVVLAVGFGGLHVVFGLIIVARYGG